jgi:hypothetical protein
VNIHESPPFTIVVPLIPQHDNQIIGLLKTLVKEQNLIEEIIFCRSETKGSVSHLTRKIQKQAKSVGFKKNIRLDCVSTIARDGTNRNRGWNLALSRFVAFMDADDLYSDNRLSKLLQALETSGADAVVHNYNSTGTLTFRNSLTMGITVQVKSETDGSYCLADNLGNPLKVHHAHITVKNSVKKEVMFTNRFPGADTEFAIGIVNKGMSMVYLKEELSTWNRHRSLRYMIRLYKLRAISKIKKLMK